MWTWQWRKEFIYKFKITFRRVFTMAWPTYMIYKWGKITIRKKRFPIRSWFPKKELPSLRYKADGILKTRMKLLNYSRKKWDRESLRGMPRSSRKRASQIWAPINLRHGSKYPILDRSPPTDKHEEICPWRRLWMVRIKHLDRNRHQNLSHALRIKGLASAHEKPRGEGRWGSTEMA